MKKNSKKFGAPPGTLIYTGENKTSSSTLTLTFYNLEEYNSNSFYKVEEFLEGMSNKNENNTSKVHWIQIQGISNIDSIQKIGEYFSIHQLILEDIVSVNQRPKFEEHQDYIVCIIQVPFFEENEHKIKYSQFTLILKNLEVLTFEEQNNVYTSTIKKRIESKKGRVRSMKSDYLFYVLLDIILDGYFNVIDTLNTQLEELEEELITNPTKLTLNKIYTIRREILYLRRLSSSNRELVNELYYLDSKLVSKKIKPFLKDLYDHSIQISELIDTKRELISTMLDLYQSSLANKTNEVMKVLTMFASIFIPLTFIAGIYGMNFEYMPELTWRWAYFGVWGVFIVVSLSLIIYFKKKKWI